MVTKCLHTNNQHTLELFKKSQSISFAEKMISK